MVKREDIQGIRGLAIAAVLAFHLDESFFPAGFVGVDMFFVLSGYLMAVILSKEDQLDMTGQLFIIELYLFRNFYTRRFKRIVPLYAILISSLTLIVPCFLLRRDVIKYCKDVLWAAVFATNIHTVLEDKDYFAELYDSNVLTHTWSLGVEIQYYLIVPFISLTQRKLSHKCSFFPFLPILLIASLAFQIFSSAESAFNLLPSRVWQFLAGGLSHEHEEIEKDFEELEKDVEEENDHSIMFSRALGHLSTDFMSCVLFALVLSPWMILSVPLLRPLAVFITSVLLVAGCEESRQGILLTIRLLVYLGDISYVMYLAHWPIIIMWKSVFDSSSLSPIAVSMDLAAAMEWNERVSHNEYGQHRPFPECLDDPEGQRMRHGYTGKGDRYECIWKPKNATGSLEVLVIGNSVSHLAIMILKPIIEENFPQVSLVRLYAMPACKPIQPADRNCPPFLKAIPLLVEAMQPDITFVIFDDDKRLRAPLLNVTTDEAANGFIDLLTPIANYSRVVVLDEFYPYPYTATGMGISMYKRLLRNQSITDFKASYESFLTSYVHYFERLDLLRFPNLIRHNTSAALCGEEKGWCWWYNRRNLHSYFTDYVHLTPDGLELLRDSYTKILRSIIAKM